MNATRHGPSRAGRPHSLGRRLMLVIGLAMVALLLLALLVRVESARRNVQAEMASSVALVRSALPRRVTSARHLDALLDTLRAVRHVRVAFVPADTGLPTGTAVPDARATQATAPDGRIGSEGRSSAAPATAAPHPTPPADPAWKAALAWRIAGPAGALAPQPVPLDADSPVQGRFDVRPDPVDEIDEAIADFSRDAALIVACALALAATVAWITRAALRPLLDIQRALLELGEGRLHARLDEAPAAVFGAAELQALPGAFNAMAGSLQHAALERERLLERLVSIEEATRRTLAHDLHDGLSPYLVAMRPHVRLLEAELRRRPGQHDLAGTAGTLSAHLAEVARRLPRLLARLHPPELAGAGLAGALRALAPAEGAAAGGRTTRLDVRIEPGFEAATAAGGVALETNLYRAAQECVLNAVKHSDGTRITIGLTVERDPGGLRAVLVVDNDGACVDHGFERSGFGVAGLRDRARAHGGRFDSGPRTGGGWRARLELPVRAPQNAPSQQQAGPSQQEPGPPQQESAPSQQQAGPPQPEVHGQPRNQAGEHGQPRTPEPPR